MAQFVLNYTDCGIFTSLGNKENYRGLWRRTCKYRESTMYASRKKDLTPVFDDEVGMWRLGDEGYYEGSPEFPSYFMICPKTPRPKHPRTGRVSEECKSAFRISDGAYFYYSFPHRMFWEHQQIHRELKEKIMGFVIQSK